jgi:hypothetical protein
MSRPGRVGPPTLSFRQEGANQCLKQDYEMFAAKSLTMRASRGGQFADRTLALVVMTDTNDKMCRFAPSVAVAASIFV